MAQNVYEGMFILDSNRYGRDAEGVSGRVEQLIGQFGGEMLVSRLWEERRLAYPIKGQRKGTYWLTYFRLDTQQLKELLRQCEIEDAILRQLILKVDPRLVETLVSHASTEQGEAPEEAAAEEGEAETVAAGQSQDQ